MTRRGLRSARVFYPYRSYKRTHLQHHADERLTDPFDDPESYYRAMSDWETMPALLKRLLAWNNTLIGRVLIGPPLMVVGFTTSEWRKISRAIARSSWHGPSTCRVIPTLLAVSNLFGIPVWLYIGVSAYLGFPLSPFAPTASISGLSSSRMVARSSSRTRFSRRSFSITTCTSYTTSCRPSHGTDCRRSIVPDAQNGKG